MPQIKLRNNSKGNVRKGTLVKVDPSNPKAFLIANYGDNNIIGTVAVACSSGMVTTINTINTVSYDEILNVPESTGVGEDGKDGYTPIKGVDYFDGATGAKGDKGDKGDDGYTPIKGVDYNDGVKGDKGDKGDTGAAGQNGSDASVTKSNVESVLTGEITTHSHPSSGGLTQAQILTRQL